MLFKYFFIKREYKYCPRCDKIKITDQFSNGQNYCKLCHYKYVLNWRREHPEKVQEYNIRYKEKIDAQ